MSVIFLIRHAEKPDGSRRGINESGTDDQESLIPRGWQRAGAIAVFFGSNDDLPAPDQIYAAASGEKKVAPHVGEVTKWGPFWRAGFGDWLHFAGEHTSYAFMGYMEGALSSAYRLARRLALRDGLFSCLIVPGNGDAIAGYAANYFQGRG